VTLQCGVCTSRRSRVSWCVKILLKEGGTSSKMDYSGSGPNQEMDDQGSVLPGYVPYLSLMFKIIATTMILLLSSWVVYTIKTTTSLHKPHNIFVANLLVSDMMTVMFLCIISSYLKISFQLEMEPYLSYRAIFIFRLFSSHVNNMSILIIAADKVLAITSPFKHKRMMSSRVISAVICGAWLLAVTPSTYSFVNLGGLAEVPEYGDCLIEDSAQVEWLLVYVLPIFTSSTVAITLNVHLGIKAYQVRKEIDKEARLSGQSKNIVALKKKQQNIIRHRKPIITLLVIILGSTLIPLLIVPLLALKKFMIDSLAYHQFMYYVIVPNVVFVVRFFHPLVYGLYFKQVRQPMMRCLKRLVKVNKFNSVAPQP